jgi:hypothetical protein
MRSLHPSARRHRLARFGAVLPVVFFAACASYTHRTAQALSDFRRGHFPEAQQSFEDPETTDSAFLRGAESGTVALTGGDWERARLRFQEAVDAARDIEGRALLGPEKLAEGLASWALNDASRAYQGEGFERVYVHCGLAMAYLAEGKLDDVYVEARLANQLLETEEKLYETTYEAGGWGHLLSATTYELLGEPDQAYIDYERMVEKGVGTAIAGRALVRLATRMRRDEDLDRWVERFGADIERPDDAATVVVLAGVGLGPFKVEGGLTLPTPDGVFQMAVPSYRSRPQPVSALRLSVASGEGVVTETVERVSKVAAENLDDRLGWIAAKSIARGVLKRELTKKLEKDHGVLGRLAGDIFTLATERADLRSWLTLPDSFQAARLFVPPGAQSYTLEAVGGEAVDLGTFWLDPGETLLVYARSLDSRLYTQVIGGRPVPSTASSLEIGTP